MVAEIVGIDPSFWNFRELMLKLLMSVPAGTTLLQGPLPRRSELAAISSADLMCGFSFA